MMNPGLPHNEEALPAIPKERDYPQTAEGAKDYARDFGEWLRTYIDRRNKHREVAIDMLAGQVVENTADLARGEHRPGWVQVQMGLLRNDIAALLDDNKGIRRRQWWVLTASVSALLSLLVVLAAEVIRSGAGS